MRAIELLTEDKIPHIAKTMGHKVLAAFEKDTNGATQIQNKEPTAEEIIEFLAGHDPQGQKHLQWMIKMYANGTYRLEDSTRLFHALSQFVSKKNALPIKDIGQYKSLADLEDAVEDQEVVKSKRQEKQDIKTEGADVIFKSAAYTIIHLKTEAAATYYGKNTKWCTTGNQNNMFDYYNEDGPIYVILDHKIDKKFQVHWESEQFMNARDEQIDAYYMVDMYPALKKTIKTPGAAYKLAHSANKPYPDLEPLIAKSGVASAGYAMYVTDQRFPAGEPAIIKAGMEDDFDGPYKLSEYMEMFINGPWPEAEPALANHGDLSLTYALDNLGSQRFLEGEANMAKFDIDSSIIYARDILKGRWPLLENNILEASHDAVEEGYDYAPLRSALKYIKHIIKGPWKEMEPLLAQDAGTSFKYSGLLGRRFTQGESAIATDVNLGISYAKDTLKGRFPKLEQHIFKKGVELLDYMHKIIIPMQERWPEFEKYLESGRAAKEMNQGMASADRENQLIALATKYAADVIHTRWPAMEPQILQIPTKAVVYAQYIIKGRWPELEPILFEHGSPELILKYGKNLVQGEWPEFEANITNTAALVSYAINIKKARLTPEQENKVEAEAKGNNMGTWDWYRDKFNLVETVETLRKKAGL